MTTFRTFAAGATIALAFTATITGCSSNDSVSTEDGRKSVEQGTSAVELAQQHIANSTAFELDATRNGWEVEVVVDGNATEVQINQDGTEVTGTRDDGRVDTDDSARISRASIPMTDPIAAAAAADGVSGRLTGVELDRFRVRTLVWSVEFNDGNDEIEVSVDAANGSVINVDRD